MFILSNVNFYIKNIINIAYFSIGIHSDLLVKKRVNSNVLQYLFYKETPSLIIYLGPPLNLVLSCSVWELWNMIPFFVAAPSLINKLTINNIILSSNLFSPKSTRTCARASFQYLLFGIIKLPCCRQGPISLLWLSISRYMSISLKKNHVESFAKDTSD